MKVLILTISLVLSAIGGVYARQAGTELPDYTKWLKQVDHNETYLYGGKEAQVRDQHYILDQGTSRQLVLVYYKVEDNSQAWFAIHMVLDSSGNLSGSLFERKGEAWALVQRLSQNDLDDMAEVFKSRYGLVESGK